MVKTCKDTKSQRRLSELVEGKIMRSSKTASEIVSWEQLCTKLIKTITSSQ